MIEYIYPPLYTIIIVWLMFFSGFSKRARIIASLALTAVLFLGLWLEDAGKNPRTNLIKPEQISVCGVSGEFSYRSNYNVTICLRNESPDSELRRIVLGIAALDCAGGECTEVERVEKQIQLVLAPGEQSEIVQNLRFDKLPHADPAAVADDSTSTTKWAVEVAQVWALD